MRILLAWEYGGARGHISNLKFVAESLGGEHQYYAALRSIDFAAELAPLCAAHMQGPKLGVSKTPLPVGLETFTILDGLAATGLSRPDWTAENVDWWRKQITHLPADLVIGECAPRAMLAARSLGVPCVAISSGFFVLPPGYRPPAASEEVEAARRGLVEAVAAAMSRFGGPGIDHLADIVASDLDVVTTLPMLDPHLAQRVRPLVPPNGPMPMQEEGDVVAAYLSNEERRDKEILRALRQVPLKVRLVAPQLSPEAIALLGTERLQVQSRPLPIAEFVRGARLVVHSSNHGTTCVSTTAGLPQLAMPQHHEQIVTSRMLAELGVGRFVPKPEQATDRLVEALQEAFEDRAMLEQARRVATEVAPFVTQDRKAVLREQILSLPGLKGH